MKKSLEWTHLFQYELDKEAFYRHGVAAVHIRRGSWASVFFLARRVSNDYANLKYNV